MHQSTRHTRTCALSVDATAAVSLGAEALVQVDAVHTRGLGAAALHSSTLVHVCTKHGGASTEATVTEAGIRALVPSTRDSAAHAMRACT